MGRHPCFWGVNIFRKYCTIIVFIQLLKTYVYKVHLVSFRQFVIKRSDDFMTSCIHAMGTQCYHFITLSNTGIWEFMRNFFSLQSTDFVSIMRVVTYHHWSGIIQIFGRIRGGLYLLGRPWFTCSFCFQMNTVATLRRFIRPLESTHYVIVNSYIQRK